MIDQGILHRRMQKILSQWDYLCVICGEPFKSAWCVTQEHLIPQSMGGTNELDNLAPSHYRCNHLRGTQSVIETNKFIETKRTTLGKDFISWLNKNQPKRTPSLNKKRKRKKKKRSNAV